MFRFLKIFNCLIITLSSVVATGQDLQMVMQTGHSLPVTDLSFTTNGNYLLSTSQGVIKVWDFINRKELKSIVVDGVVGSMISLSDTTVAFIRSKELVVMNLKTGDENTWAAQTELTSLDYSPSKKLLVVGGKASKVQLITLDFLEATAVIDLYPKALKFSPSGDSLFVADSLNLSVINTFDAKEIKKLPIRNIGNLDLAGGTKLAVHDNEKVNVIDVRNGKVSMTAYGDRAKDSFVGVGITSDHKYIVGRNSSKFIYTWTPKGKLKDNKFFDKEIVSIEAHPSQELMVMGAADGRIWTYDLRTMSLREDLKSSNQPVAAVNFIDQRKTFTAIQGSNLRVYDFEGPLQVKDLRGEVGKPVSTYKEYLTGAASIGKDSLVTAGGDNRVRLWNVATGHSEIIGKGTKAKGFWLGTPLIVGYFGSFYNAALLPLIAVPLKARSSLAYMAVDNQNNRMAPSAITGSIRTFDASTFESQKISPFFMSTFTVSLNDDGTMASAVGNDLMGESVKVLDLTNIKKEKVVWKNRDGVDYKTVSAIHPTKTEVAFDNRRHEINYYNYSTGASLKKFEGFAPLKFGPDQSSFFYQLPDFSINSIDPATFEQRARFTGHSNTVTTFDIGSDKLITGSADGTIRIWDLKTGKEIVTVVSLPDNNFIFKTPDNYYYCSKSALKLVSFTKELKFFPFEQFDLQYNRPDIVLERLGMTSEELIHAYRRAYAKRLKKMNFSEEVFSKDFHLPEVTVRRPGTASNQRTVDLHITANDTRYKLDRINIYVNNVPLHGANGIDIKNRNTQHLSQTIPVELNRGKNQVLVTVHNEKGVESLGETFEIQYSGAPGKPDLYVLAIGVSKYQQSSMDLTYASKDARDMAQLISQRKNKFENIFIDTLLNQNATLEKIMASANKLKQAKVDDHVIVFIAGHGLLNTDLDYYVATHDIDFLKPEVKGLAYEQLEEMLMDVPARNKVLLMDACHSGEVDKEEVMLVAANTEKVEGGQIQFRSVNGKVVPRVGLQNSFELMKHLFADLRRGSGTSVVSSAGGAEYAMEGREWKNGIFTYCLVSGLKDKKADIDKDGKVMLSELQKYLQIEVPRLTSGKQTPTSRAENLYNDVEIW